MQVSASTLILGAVVLTAGSFALGRETAPTEARVVAAERAEPAEDPNAQNMPDPGSGSLIAGGAAMNMPGMGSMGGARSSALAADDEAPAIEWTVPPAWRVVPNPSAMRIATYAVPHAPGDATDADVSVSRAGGDVASNIERWVGQFPGTDAPKPTTRLVHGYEVTTLSIEGVYTGGMAPGQQPQPGFALLAAIVQTKGMPYFFKMTGPAATVRAARAAFTAMIDGVRGAG